MGMAMSGKGERLGPENTRNKLELQGVWSLFLRSKNLMNTLRVLDIGD